MAVPSHGLYLRAKKIVDAYEANERKKHEAKLNLFKKDLANYFESNKISGHTIKKFSLNSGYSGDRYDIVPMDPPLEECYEGENNGDIEIICKKHGIDATFVSWMYHK